jgi:predicted NBD/HSP70 family sugar kinase
VSATARVLTVMARLGTFTVEELAARSGVSSATVHTVLRRNSSFTREIGVKPTGRPGGQPRRYQVDPEREVELRDALAKIRAGLLPAEDADEPVQLPAELAADPIWMPLSVPAAESILLDEVPETPAEQWPDLLRAADEYIDHARRVLASTNVSEPTRPLLAAHLDLLDFARSVAEAEIQPVSQVECRALLERWPKLQWNVIESHARSRIVDRLLSLVLHCYGAPVGVPASVYAGTSAPERSGRTVDEPVLVGVAWQLAEDQTLGGVLTDLVRKEPTTPQSAAAVAKRTGLPEPTVSHTMHRLFRNGWLNAAPLAPSGESRFSLTDNRGLMIGMSLYRSHVDAVLTTLRTTRVIDRREHQLPDTSPQSVVQTVVELAQELRGTAGPRQDIVGLGVAVAGRVDATGTVFFAPDLKTDEHRWIAVTLEDDLEAATRVTAFGRAENRVAVENDANALGMYEYLLRAPDQDVAVVLMSESGEGIGCGLVINGALVHGAEGIGGEIGHVVVAQNGKPCRCGGKGCLETVASAAAIVDAVKGKSKVPVDDLRAASALVEHGNAPAFRAFTMAGEALGRVLSILMATVGQPRVVIFGPRQLTQEFDVTSARAFMDGVRGTHRGAILDVKVDLVPRVLDDATLPTAAAATAVNYFLSRPRRWMPAIANIDISGGPRQSPGRARAGATR